MKYAKSQYELGVLYRYGRGVPEDIFKAFEWYEKAAKYGHSESQYEIGKLYQYGHGVERNYTKAKEWYKRACDNGEIDGCFGYEFVIYDEAN